MVAKLSLGTASRRLVLAAADSERMRQLVETAPLSRDVVARFVGGAGVGDAVSAAQGLREAGLLVTIDRLGEDVTSREQAEATVAGYLDLLTQLVDRGLTQDGNVEVSLKLSALGQSLPEGVALSTELAQRICQAAADAGTTVTVDAEDHTTTDDTLSTVVALRADHPWVGAVVQAYLYRTEGDCRDLAGEGSRVRLCKGAYREPESVAYQRRHDVDLSYVRCLKVLLEGRGKPLIATHDPRLVSLAGAMAVQRERPAGSYEHQMLFGVRPDEQRRLAGLGESVRVYVPYGDQWYGYLMRRIAERPANAAFFARALAGTR